jgi:hypothetical protein
MAITAIPTVGTLSEISTTDFPFDVKYGTGKRRKLIMLRCTPVHTGNNIDLATYIPALADIEGFAWQTINDKAGTTSNTWGTTTITFAGGGTGVWEIGVIANLT